MARMVFVAVLSSAFFVTLGVLAQPLPSRSLARPIPAPEAVAAYAALVPATAAIPLDTPVHRLLRPQAARPSAPIQLASTTVAPAADTQTVSSAPARERRPNFLGRLVHGMLHPTRVIAAG
jgi:hypothetical protein